MMARCLVSLIALFVMVGSLATQSGCTCIIDPCPMMTRRTYTWQQTNRVAWIGLADADRITITSNETILLIYGEPSSLRHTELVDAQAGDTLSNGGYVESRFWGEEVLDGVASSTSQLIAVRIDPTLSVNNLSVSAEWDIEDCDETPVPEMTFYEQESYCGDGFIEDLEICDDENEEADDGCFGCEIETGACAEDRASWSYWSCEGEPSECELHDCEMGSDDPVCETPVVLEADFVVDGFVRPGYDNARIVSDPSGVDCWCEESAASFECSPTCLLEVSPCTILSPAITDRIVFDRWEGDCSGDQPCSVIGESSSVVGVFSSFISGIEDEEEFVPYPRDDGELLLTQMDARGGRVVAAGYLLGEFENPGAADFPPGSLPEPFIFSFNDQLDVLWTYPLETASNDTVLTVHDIAVDGEGNGVLAVGLFGTLSLESGTVVVQSEEHPGTEPQEIVLIKISALGEHLWSTHVTLPEPYDLRSARIDISNEGVVSLAASVDYRFYGTDSALDLITARISAEGGVTWLWTLRLAEDRSPLVLVNPNVSVAMDGRENIFIVGGVNGEGPFRYDLGWDIEAGSETLFLARFSTIGEHLWSRPHRAPSLDMLQMTVDENGQTVVFTEGRIVAYTEENRIAWSRDITSRPFDDSFLGEYQTWRLAGEPTTGELVLSTDASTFIGSTSFLSAIVTSKFSAEGELLWTVRHESPQGEQFTSTGLAMAEEDVFVLGSILDSSGTSRSAVIRRIVDAW